MLEILLLIFLAKRIGNIVEVKGYKSGKYKFLLVGLWIGGEIFGSILGGMLTAGNDSALVYLFALLGAASGASLTFAIVNNLSVIDPSLSPAQKEQMAASARSMPAVLLFFLWLMINILYIYVFSLSFGLLNSIYGQSKLYTTYFSAKVISGIVVGALQCFLLLFMLPNAKRWHFFLWIPASLLGGIVGAVIFALVPRSALMSFFSPILIGMTLGIAEWFILKIYSKAAFWWIPANIIDQVFAWVFVQLLLGINSNSIANTLIISVVGSITTSIAIVFILKKASTEERADIEDIPQIQFD